MYKSKAGIGGLIAFLASVLTMTGFFIQVGAVNILYASLVLSCIVIIVLLWITYSQYKKIRDLEIRSKEKTAFDMLQRNLKKCENPYLTIKKVLQRVYIKSVDANVEREYIGKNGSNKNVDAFITYATGDKRLSFDRISFRAYEVRNKEKKPLELIPIIDKDPSVFKLAEIKFREPLKQNERFHILIKYNWPGAMSQDDYVTLALFPYKPIAGAECEITFDRKEEPMNWNFKEIATGRVIQSKKRKENRKVSLKFVVPPQIADGTYKFTFHP